MNKIIKAVGAHLEWTGCWAVLGIMFLMSILAASFYKTMGHDQAMHLEIGRLLLSGQIGFVDFYELQFPSSMFLQIFPAFLERFLPVSPVFAFFLWTIGFTFYSCLACYVVGRRFGLFSNEDTIFIAVSVAGISLAADFYSFGLREHFFILAFLPFLLLRLGRLEKGNLYHGAFALVGFAAGIAVTMKPYFLVFPFLLEGYIFVQARRKYGTLLNNREWHFFALGVAVFVVHFILLGKDYFFSFWNLSLKYGMTGYNAYNAPLESVAGTLVNSKQLFFLLALLWCLWRTRAALFEKHLAVVLSLCFGGSVLIYLLQQKGWSYQALPVHFFGVLIVILAARHLVKSRFLIGCGFLFYLWQGISGFLNQEPPELFRYLQERAKPAKTLLFLGTSVYGPYPANLMVDGAFSGTFLWLYPLAGSYDRETFSGYHSVKEMPRLEKLMASILYHDLLTQQPDLIVMNQYGQQAMNPRFDLSEYLESIPPIRKMLKAHYERESVRGVYIYEKRES